MRGGPPGRHGGTSARRKWSAGRPALCLGTGPRKPTAGNNTGNKRFRWNQVYELATRTILFIQGTVLDKIQNLIFDRVHLLFSVNPNSSETSPSIVHNLYFYVTVLIIVEIYGDLLSITEIITYHKFQIRSKTWPKVHIANDWEQSFKKLFGPSEYRMWALPNISKIAFSIYPVYCPFKETSVWDQCDG